MPFVGEFVQMKKRFRGALAFVLGLVTVLTFALPPGASASSLGASPSTEPLTDEALADPPLAPEELPPTPPGPSATDAPPAGDDGGTADSTNRMGPATAPPPDLVIDATAPDGTSAITEEDRASVIGEEWASSPDVAWSLSGDADGLDILVAEGADGYDWQRVATLSVPGFDTDRWIGNACLTGDSDTLAVVYAPRGFVNNGELFSHGAFAALIELDTGHVHQLGAGYTLAYFNPGCGVESKVALTQLDDSRTRVVTVNAQAPQESSSVEVDGHFTSAVPDYDGLVAAAPGAVVRIDEASEIDTVLPATGTPYDLSIGDDGEIAYLTHDGTTATAYRVTGVPGEEAVPLASAPLEQLGLVRTAEDRLHLLGTPELSTVDQQDVAVHSGTRATATLSSAGVLAVEAPVRGEMEGNEPEWSDDATDPIVLTTQSLPSGKRIEFRVRGDDDVLEANSGALRETSTLSAASATAAAGESPTSPVSAGSPCAIPRNDPAIQAFQPNLAEVEWAVDQAVQGNLPVQATTFGRPALDGSSASGGTHVPPQIVLGILAQESNFWQASKFTVPGVTGNPLMGDYYGVRSAESDEPWWTIDYNHADCGYGIAQVTTGMRAGEMPYNQQVMIATDYRANISRGLQLLISKWNETRAAGLTINNGHPKYLENWFYALWAYNTGFYPNKNDGEPWGVGWLNNPINPIYEPNRGPFLDGSPGDAANPQRWPYPEKVLGFAAHSAYFLNSVTQATLGDYFHYATAFAPAWWTSADKENGEHFRRTVKPPVDLFCDESNYCDKNMSIPIPGEGYTAPCYHKAYAGGPYDLRCWYNKAATWKNDCASACGYESMTYKLTDAKPISSSSYMPNCTKNGLPSSALVVDDVPSSVSSQRCTPTSTVGKFEFTFAPGPDGRFPSKIDTHQLGAGFNGHFTFTRARIASVSAEEAQHLAVSGKWSLNQSLAGRWTRVMVHMPSHGAWSQQALYEVNTGSAVVTRSVNQRNYADKWISLGTFLMTGSPSVTLKNNSGVYTDQARAAALHGEDDIAWDAVAFVPLEQKPADFVVALGDSYSSGEGTSLHSGEEFFRGSDHNGSSEFFGNACHRSPYAWPFKVDPPNIPGASTVGDLVNADDTRLDFQMLACAGAETENLLPRDDTTDYAEAQQYGERTQLDRGFLDSNTTVVTLTIGGNDIGFGPIIETCIKSLGALASPPTECKNDPAPANEFSGTLGQMVDSRLEGLAAKVTAVLQEVRQRAPYARIVMMGYPSIFDDGVNCVFLSAHNRPWLDDVTSRLNAVLTKAAFDAGTYVTYESPQYRFKGHNVCADDNALQRLVLQTTPGDKQTIISPPNGPSFGISAQSVHPNKFGSDLYAKAANNALTAERLALSGSLVAGASTTYYATMRWLEGPTSMSVSAFSSCGGELRLGLRSGAQGSQSSNSLSWRTPHNMQNFLHAPDSLATPDVPGNTYALNARMTTSCSGGGTQTWAGDLYR